LEIEEQSRAERNGMLDRGRHVLESLLRQFLDDKYVARISLADHDYRSWQWPYDVKRAVDIPDALSQIPPEEPSTHSLYPVSIWLVEESGEGESIEAIRAFEGEPDSTERWRELINSGIIRGSLTGSTLTLSFRCQQFDGIAAHVRSTAKQLDAILRWIT